MMLYADFNDRDYAGLIYGGTTNQWLANSAAWPYFVDIPSGRGIISHTPDSPGVLYLMSSNKILNPVKGTIEFRAKPFKNPSRETTLLDIRTNTNGLSILKLSIDPAYGTVVSILNRKYYLDNNWDTRWYDNKSWKKLRLEYSLYETQSRSYLKFYADDELIARVESIGWTKLPVPLNGRLYFGFSPDDLFTAGEHFYLDELKVYEEVQR